MFRVSLRWLPGTTCKFLHACADVFALAPVACVVQPDNADWDVRRPTDHVGSHLLWLHTCWMFDWRYGPRHFARKGHFRSWIANQRDCGRRRDPGPKAYCVFRRRRPGAPAEHTPRKVPYVPHGGRAVIPALDPTAAPARARVFPDA